jgi:hypothetical protein
MLEAKMVYYWTYSSLEECGVTTYKYMLLIFGNFEKIERVFV